MMPMCPAAQNRVRSNDRRAAWPLSSAQDPQLGLNQPFARAAHHVPVTALSSRLAQDHEERPEEDDWPKLVDLISPRIAYRTKPERPRPDAAR
jgi:hypothetical protein